VTGWEPRSEFLRELNAEARAEALVEGEERGVAIGEVRILRSNVGELLLHRFGALSPEQTARLQSASFDTLQGWFKGALTAPSIDAALQELPEAK
jgi:hypothetical protein